MQVNRLFEIVYLLLKNQTMTAGELAERFEVSTRTIYRDIDALSGAGIPVYAAKGKGGGIRLLPDFVLNKSLLSDQEQNEILFALRSFEQANALENTQVLSRLSGLFQKEPSDWIDVDFSHWGNNPEEKEKFQLLKTGILERRILSFGYFASDGTESFRTVEPVKLLMKSSCWYLQAFCLERLAYRTFKIFRMKNLELSQTHFIRRVLPLPPVDTVGTFGADPITAQLKFVRGMAYRVYDEFEPAEVQLQPDGSLLVTTPFFEDHWVYGYLLSFGDGVEVLSPPHLRRVLKEKAEKIASQYHQC